jgi:hypothetical protein
MKLGLNIFLLGPYYFSSIFYFVLFSLISFSFRWFRFISLISFRFVSLRFCWFRFVSFRFVFVDFVSFRFRWFRFISKWKKNNRGLKEIKLIFTITMLDYMYFPHMFVFHQERTGFDHHWTRILCIYSAGVCPFHLVASFKCLSVRSSHFFVSPTHFLLGRGYLLVNFNYCTSVILIPLLSTNLTLL